jgi:hypothetical protein
MQILRSKGIEEFLELEQVDVGLYKSCALWKMPGARSVFGNFIVNLRRSSYWSVRSSCFTICPKRVCSTFISFLFFTPNYRFYEYIVLG